MSEAAEPSAIPDGLVFRRTAWYGAYATPKFDDFDWDGKVPNKECKEDCHSPIFLYQSEPYLVGTALVLQEVNHYIVARVCLEDRKVYMGGKSVEYVLPTNAAEYETIDFFWNKHPDSITTFYCDGQVKEHQYSSPGDYCTHCSDDLNFDNDMVTDMMKESLQWPFPIDSILASKTSIRTIDTSSTTDMRNCIASLQRHLGVAHNLLEDQQVVNKSAKVRQELEEEYDRRVVEITQTALTSSEQYRRLTRVGLDKDSVEGRINLLTSRLEAIENGQAIAELQEQVQLLLQKIAALQTQAK